MRTHTVLTHDGEMLLLVKIDSDNWVCPICGTEGLASPPYFNEGGSSFEMCSFCKFEFGFDDEPTASREAISGVKNNWDRWRNKLIEKARYNPQFKTELASNLQNLGISI